jgi:superfamily II DNA/RNA helicase
MQRATRKIVNPGGFGREECAHQGARLTQTTDAGTEAGKPNVVQDIAAVLPANQEISVPPAFSEMPETGAEAVADCAPPPELSTQPPTQPMVAEASQSAPAGFEGFGLSESLMKAIVEAGYKTPTPIQAEGIPHAMKRRDLIGIAQTGTGKTASFALPMIELLMRGRAKARMPRSLILEPTRELAAQVAESFEQFTKYNKLSMALLIGGVSFEDQDRKLDRGVDILIATPGRLLDHFERGKLMMSQVQILVIDEADRMLDMGFIPDVERICKLIPFTRQTLFYSATMPTEIRRLTDQFLQNPVRVEVTRPATTADNIAQTIVDVPASDWAKREALRRLIGEAGEIKNAIVFCNRKHDVDIVARSLKTHGFNAAPLHGDLDQSVRMRTLDAFRAGEVAFLVASDVAARGLDIPDVSHIFNYDVPYHPDDYVHRVGRTGRAGRSGIAFMLATPRDGKYVEEIEKLTHAKLTHRTLEGLADAVREHPPREGRGGGGRDRDRGHDRRQQRARPIKPHGQVAAIVPAKPDKALKPVVPVRADPAVKSVKSPPSRRPARPAPNRMEPTLPDPSELPAFLLRPVRLPLPAKKPAAKKKATVKKTKTKPAPETLPEG